MKTLFMVVFCIYVVIGGLSMVIGLDLKKWYSWLIGVFGFITGFLMGMVKSDIQTAITMGMLFPFFTLTSAALTHWNRKRSLQFIKKLDN